VEAAVVYFSLRPMISPLAATWLKPYWLAAKNFWKRLGWQLALTAAMPVLAEGLPAAYSRWPSP